MAAMDKAALARLVRSERLNDPRIADAFERIAREDFVPPRWRGQAYIDEPVELPEHQTTSQPSLIARMIDAAAPRADDRVLEVGTGYGFQTALLATLAREVVSIERHQELAEAARANLDRVGIDNVRVVVGDGTRGYEEAAPYDAIIVSAAAQGSVPPALAHQLAPGGRLVIPIAGPIGDDVWLYRRTDEGLQQERLITPARFVPLVPDQ